MSGLLRIGCWNALIGLLAAGSAESATRYVNVSNATPTAPFLTWETAATDIQAAIWQSTSGDEILVAPGVYELNGQVVNPAPTQTLTLRSTEPLAAIIDAQGLSQAMQIPGTNSLVEGFTIRNGAVNGEGGGILIDNGTTLRNCLVVSNRASLGGGVAIKRDAVAENCTIVQNVASNDGGGVYFILPGILRDCMVADNTSSNRGGGIGCLYSSGIVQRCRITGNQAALMGGGAYLGGDGTLLANSVFAGNQAPIGGGLSTFGSVAAPIDVINCTIVSNAATNQHGGIYLGAATRLLNSIVYFNSAPGIPNIDILPIEDSVVSNCCAPLLTGANITNAPAFVDFAGGDYHLATASFCIDAGLASAAPEDDLDGRPRPQVGTPGGAALPDIGALEYAFHINNLLFPAGNILEVTWDEQNAGVYALDVSVPGLINPVWNEMAVHTNPGLGPGGFTVHSEQFGITPPGPAHAAFRLRIRHAP